MKRGRPVQESPESSDELSSWPCSILDPSYDASLLLPGASVSYSVGQTSMRLLAKLSMKYVSSNIIITISTLGFQGGRQSAPVLAHLRPCTSSTHSPAQDSHHAKVVTPPQPWEGPMSLHLKRQRVDLDSECTEYLAWNTWPLLIQIPG